MTKKVKITVVKRCLHEDLLGPPLTHQALRNISACRDFRDGQVFQIDGPLPAKPEGFCN